MQAYDPFGYRYEPLIDTRHGDLEPVQMEHWNDARLHSYLPVQLAFFSDWNVSSWMQHAWNMILGATKTNEVVVSDESESDESVSPPAKRRRVSSVVIDEENDEDEDDAVTFEQPSSRSTVTPDWTADASTESTLWRIVNALSGLSPEAEPTNTIQNADAFATSKEDVESTDRTASSKEDMGPTTQDASPRNDSEATEQNASLRNNSKPTSSEETRKHARDTEEVPRLARRYDHVLQINMLSNMSTAYLSSLRAHFSYWCVLFGL
jgi:hypothetical protein